MRVFQDWGAANSGEAGEQNVFVFGPKYSLHRYTNDSERSQMKPTPFESDGTSVVIEKAVEVDAVYELKTLDVYAEDAYVNVAALANDELTVEGSYLDGKLYYRGDLSAAVFAGDYIGVKDENETVFIQIKLVKKHADAEYPEVSWTEIQLSEGLPDTFSDGVPSGVSVFAARLFDSVKLNGDSFSQSEGSVTLNPKTAVLVNDEPCELVTGNLFFSYTRLYTGSSAGIQIATSYADLETLGTPDQDNPIALGVYNAFIGGAPVVYYYITEGESVESYKKALDRATLNSTLYYIVPLSNDTEVLDAVLQHLSLMSTPDIKRWRIAVVCTKVGQEVVTGGFEVIGNGEYSNPSSGTFKTLKFDSNPGDVADGDIVDVNGTEFVVAKKLNMKTVLTHSRDVDTVVTGDATIKHTRTTHEYAKAVADSAKSLGTFRCIDVFPKEYGYSGEKYSSVFLAPIIAGLSASVEPQAPITNATVPGVDDLPDIYDGYSTTDLDEIASGGVLIVAQDQLGERCYIRKQLTTGTSNGVLSQSELSMVKNYDSISHYFDTIMMGFKGSFNVTPSLLRRVWTDLKQGVYVLQNNGTSDNVGPQLLGQSAVKRVEVDPTNNTKINAYVHCDLPAPFNDMDLHLSVVTSEIAPEVG